MARRVIYSALIGGYERALNQPAADRLGVDLIMFTDRPESVAGTGWSVVPVQRRYHNDPVRSARYLKTMGHHALDAYDQTMWVDNRVQLTAGASELWGHLSGNDLVLPSHSYRSSLRAEFDEVIASGYDDPSRVRSTYRAVLAAGVAMQVRPLWTGIMLRKRTERVSQTMRMWMDHIALGSRRDQLSIQAALSQFPLKTLVLDLDNETSPYHSWVPVGEISRNRGIQRWAPAPVRLRLRLSDALRRREFTRRAARLLERSGHPLPTIE